MGMLTEAAKQEVLRFLREAEKGCISLKFCERFDEKSKIWNLKEHSHPYLEIIYFFEGKASVPTGGHAPGDARRGESPGDRRRARLRGRKILQPPLQEPHLPHSDTIPQQVPGSLTLREGRSRLRAQRLAEGLCPAGDDISVTIFPV
jgi:hypothetical protein